MKKIQEEMIEILSDKMDTLRCLSCSKYFPDPCEDCSFVEVFDNVVAFFNEWSEKLLAEERAEWVKKAKGRKVTDLPNVIRIKSNAMPEGDIVEGFTYNAILDDLIQLIQGE